MQFEFTTAGRIVFGRGAFESLPKLAAEIGRRPLLVTGRRNPPFEIGTSRFISSGEPTIASVTKGVEAFRSTGCDSVVAIGGGSVIDAGKAIAALATNPHDAMEYVEVVGRGKALEKPPAPMIAIPTTAGTGSEVTRNAVLGSPEHRVKASLRSHLMLPRIAIVDPVLSRDLPPGLTASTGLDALTQCIEPFVSSRANAMTDLYCVDGMQRIARSLRRSTPDDMDAREDMSFASLLGGLSLANAGLGVVHGFAAPIGGMFDAPHGFVCAALLPHGVAANIKALTERAPQHPGLARYRTVARLLTGEEDVAAAIDWIRELCSDLQIPGLAEYGVGLKDVPVVCEKAALASSMRANPISLTLEELQATLTAAM